VITLRRPEKKTYMGVDLASVRNAYVVLDEDGLLKEFGARTYTTKEQKNRWKRYGILLDPTFDAIQRHKPQIVNIEGYVFQFAQTAIPAIECGTLLRHWCYRNQQNYIQTAPKSLKMFVSGKGNATKDLMIAKVKSTYGWQAPTHDHADAYGLAQIARAIDLDLQAAGKLHDYQAKALQKIAQST
jgi:Holliday junction resolvasome RuvABC endonuclease subunit